MPPEIQENLTGYTLHWQEHKLTAKITRLKNHSDGKLTGDISLTLGSKNQQEPTFLFNFTSAQTRKILIKSLDEKYPEWKWLPIIDELTREVQRISSAGEPTIKIASTDEYAPLEYLVEPIIPLGKPTAIFGDPGSGKSQLLLILAIVAALPWQDNPLKLGAPKESSPILLLDYEADEDDIRRSLHHFAEGMDLGYIPIDYRRCSLPIADDLEAIRNHVDAIGAKAVFIDSTSLAAGGDLNRMDVATNYIRALRQLKLTSVSLTHTSKDRDAKTKTIIGSVLFEAGFRSVFECRGQEDDDTLDIALLHRKFNLGGKVHPLGYRIHYNGAGSSISWHDPKSVPEFVERMGNNRRILDLLKGGPLPMKEITEILEITYQAANISLNRMEKKQLVLKLSDKQWGLASKLS